MTEQDKEELLRKVVTVSNSIWKNALKNNAERYHTLKQMVGRAGRPAEISGVEPEPPRPQKAKTRWRSIDADFTN